MASNKGRKFERFLFEVATGHGATSLVIERPGGRHPRLRGEVDGRSFVYFFSNSPSDVRTHQNAKANLRRLIQERAAP